MAADRKPERAAIYARISRAPDGSTYGVERQEKLTRRLADRKGWPVAEVYTDNDLSAFSGKERPAYQRMLDDLRKGRRDGVLVVDTDRLTRSVRELEDIIDLAERHNVSLANVSGDIDLSTSDGRYNARQQAIGARRESERLSERIQREREERAADGRPHPGPRPFGYETDGMSIRESEAKLVRAAAAEILAGRSIRSVVAEWNDAGIVTPRSRKPWTPSRLTDLLCSPRIAGLRQYKGEIVGDAAWPAIIDRETHERLRAAAESRKAPVGRPPARLLSTVLYCGLCQQRMRSGSVRSKGGRKVYRCVGCKRLTIAGDRLDKLVRDAVLFRLADSDLLERIARLHVDADHARVAADLRADEERLEALEIGHFVDDQLSKGAYLKARKRLQTRIDRARRRLRAVETVGVLADVPTGPDVDLPGWWGALDVDTQRRFVERLIERITVDPVEYQGARDIAARVPPDNWTWRV